MKYRLLASLVILMNVVFTQNSLSIEDIWGRSYYKTFNQEYVYGLRSMKDGNSYTVIRNDRESGTQAINKHSYAGTRTPIIPMFNSKGFTNIAGEPFQFDDYAFSSDESKIILSTETEAIYRHSSKSHFYIYDIASKKLEKLTTEGSKQMYATPSPTGNRIAFVRDNNIFITDLDSKKESQVTADGEYNHIINGATDWVYEEEFAFDKAFFWSPDGQQIAFYKFDESQVKEFNMAMYGSLYPTDYKFKYPKAGEANAIVSIHVCDVKSNTTKTVNIGEELDQYIPRIKWTKAENTLMVYRMNRHQNKLELLKVKTISDPRNIILQSEVIYTETSKAFIEITDDIRFLEDGKSYIWTSDKGGWNHLYLNTLDGKQKQITYGEWTITTFYGIDENNGLYYQAAKVDPSQREVYKTDISGKKTKTLSEKAGVNGATFSSTMNYFINDYSNANTAPFITLHEGNGKQIKVLKSNEGLNKTLQSYNFSNKEFFDFNTTENVNLKGWMIKPKNFVKDQKYPVYMYQYSGPNSQEVMDSYAGRAYLWHQFLAQEGYVVVCVDGRGTGARGVDFQKCTYQELGKLETIDQIETAKYLGGLSFVDKDRIGIQGWSYGGFMASLCMTKGADCFKAGIAVAPVTNWRYYDSVYTERYMRTPQENASGYDDNSPINHVEKMKGAYLLVHGSADDNVHYQNTMEMVSELVNHNKQFDLFIYPNKNHGIYGGNTRLHLFTKMFNFVEDNLKN